VLKWTAERKLTDLQDYLDAKRSEFASDVINALDVVSTITTNTTYTSTPRSTTSDTGTTAGL
jgi:hypothetical protein